MVSTEFGLLIDDELDEINKFSVGKHGGNEVTKTFKRIGVDAKDVISDFEDINNFFNLRNGIVHPENIAMTKTLPPSPNEIRKYILLLYLYIKKINTHLSKNILSNRER
ncbi:MAG: HEPN domain-containing protein [Mariprofundaceae bacterium]|nr:HEPN domain-containing protein [Mariprofundaceae bacterium]